MSEILDINPGLEANAIVSPDNLHTEPPFVRPSYEPEDQPEPELEEEPKAKKAKAPKKASSKAKK